MSSPRRATAAVLLALVGASAARAQSHAPAPTRAAHGPATPAAPAHPAPAPGAHAPPTAAAPAAAHAAPAPAAPAHGATSALEAAHSPCVESSAATAENRPVLPGTAGPEYAAFIDPAARVEAGERVRIGCRAYVAPFASLDATAGPISIGAESDVQDNVTISGRVVVIGDRVIVAHGATVIGPAAIGAPGGKPAFVGFNAFVDGATIEEDAMVMHLARVAPGIVVRAGTKVLPGKFVRTQAEADSESLGKIARLVDADRVFMAGVLHVNTSLARHYAELQQLTPSLVRGAGRDPGESDFNAVADLPTFAGRARALPEMRNRIIGRVELADAAEKLDSVMGRGVSIRADEGEWFTLGHLAKVQDRVTFHALEHTGIDVGDGDWFGFHTVVHGGSDAHSSPVERTRLGGAVVVKDWAVVFRSTIGDGSVIGVRAYVDGTNLPPKSVVPDRAIMIGGKIVGTVEW